MARQAQQTDMADAEAICETPEPISFVLTRPLALIGECPRRAKTWPRPRQATLVVIAVATSDEEGRVHAASMYAAGICDTPQARHSKI